MKRNTGVPDDPRRRGAVAAMVVVMMMTIVGFAAITVDVGMMYNARGDLQRTADAAALAAAALLGDYGSPEHPVDAKAVATAEARRYVAKNAVLGRLLQLNTSSSDPAQRDVIFGRAIFDSAMNAFSFTPTEVMPNAVKVRVRMTNDSPNGALPLMFASVYGNAASEVSASAVAMMLPRDIVVVADLSGSTAWDSQLRHYALNGTEINLFDVWAAFPIQKGNAGVGNGPDPPPPGNPHSENDQPGTGPGSPANQGGNPNPGAAPFNGSGAHGPRWGWLTGYGDDLYPQGSYTPSGDVGLYEIPRYQQTTDADVLENLIQAGYSADELAALTSPAYDRDYTSYINRTKVMLGLSGWRSKLPNSKFTGGPGNADDQVDKKELWQEVAYPFDVGSWEAFVNYVARSSSPMNTSAGNFRYQFGIKTFVDYVTVKAAAHSETPELAATPLQPLQAIKDAVGHMVDRLQEYQTGDQLALAVYATDARLETPLSPVYDFNTGLADRAVADRLAAMQPAYYHTPVAYTNIDAGLEQAVLELQSPRVRGAARKVIILMTDGKANYYNDLSGQATRDSASPDYPTAKSHARAMAQAAADQGIQVFTVSVGGSADTSLMQEIADIAGGYSMHAGGSVEDYSATLDQIFKTLGGLRPVELIQ